MRPNFFPISKRRDFPSGWFGFKTFEKGSVERKERSGSRSVAIKKRKGKIFVGKSTPCFKCAKDFYYSEHLFHLAFSKEEERTRKFPHFSGFV